ncbi:MAG: hypothetical protein ACJAYU_001647 [Bradymonadia bacterium]|jgi:hypothetical protein
MSTEKPKMDPSFEAASAYADGEAERLPGDSFENARQEVEAVDDAIRAWAAEAQVSELAAGVAAAGIEHLPTSNKGQVWAAAALVFAAAAALAIYVSQPRMSNPYDWSSLVSMMVADHAGFVENPAKLALTTNEHAVVRAFLSEERGLPAESWRWSDESLLGATRCDLLGTPLAAVFMHDQQGELSVFAVDTLELTVVAPDDPGPFPGTCEETANTSTCHWLDAGWHYFAVADLGETRLSARLEIASTH